jgi:hypothetical protein
MKPVPRKRGGPTDAELARQNKTLLELSKVRQAKALAHRGESTQLPPGHRDIGT